MRISSRIIVGLLIVVMLTSIVGASHPIKNRGQASSALIGLVAKGIFQNAQPDRFFATHHQGAIEYITSEAVPLLNYTAPNSTDPPTGK